MRHSGFLVFLLLVCLLVKYAALIGIVAGIGGLLVVTWKLAGVGDRWLERREQRRAAAAAETAAIAVRADEQNALVLAGDERGVYGDYPPEPFQPNG